MIVSVPSVDTVQTLGTSPVVIEDNEHVPKSGNNVHTLKGVPERKLFADEQESSKLRVRRLFFFFPHFFGPGVRQELVSNEGRKHDLAVRAVPRKFQNFRDAEVLLTQY